ncbi:VOC family protein [Kribbella sp. NBC_01245]|uniref:VOC family protein n=1 Tax=Kribbella sp. NBC_01245 TaxID=2903578 RepID=UPI002E29794E|nr:VOC family protein [Kribbella sp. NBC_01245]
MNVRSQPMIAVSDVPRSSAWYQLVLGVSSGHGGTEYEQLRSDGVLVLQLHRLETEHHHGTIRDPGLPVGNGVALWFEVDDLDAAVRRAEKAGVQVDRALHHNPMADHRELWLRDADGYLVVLADQVA